MITAIKTILVGSSVLLLNVKNPVKIRMIVLLTGALIIILICKLRGRLWVPVLVFLLFMGGILVVFMIISSIYPNDNPIKLKKVTISVFTVTLLIRGRSLQIINETAGIQMKSVLVSGIFLSGLITFICLYFFLFVIILQREKNSLRTFL